MNIFETERLYVRRYTLNDIDVFFSLNSDEEVMRYIRKPKPYDEVKEFLLANIIMYYTKPGLGRWGVFDKSNNDYIGSFSVLPHEGHPDFHLGYALMKKHWGKGYASELTRAGIKYVFEELNFEKILGITESGNDASEKVLLKAGFVLKGNEDEDGKTLHVFELQRDLNGTTER